MKFWVLLTLALAFGLLIGWVDTRPTWDDNGVTAAAIIGITALLGTAMPNHAWVWALAVGSCISVLNIALNGNYGALLSLLVAFVGSYVGVFVRKAISFTSKATQVK